VSIIIPTFNGEKYIKRAISSALKQQYSNLEVIVSDNNSSDNTSVIAKEFLIDPRFRYFRNDTNIGMTKNWRKSLYEYTNGKFVLILSDDDYLVDNQYIKLAMNLFNRYPNIVFVFANCYILNDQNNELTSTNYSLKEEIPGLFYILNYYSPVAPHIIINSVFDREKALSVGAFSKEVLGLDVDLYFRLMLEGDIGFIRNNVTVYTIRDTSMSHHIDFSDDIRFIDNLLEISLIIKQKGVPDKTIACWLRKQALVYYRWRSSTYVLHDEIIINWVLAIKIFKRVKYFLPLRDFILLLKNSIKAIFFVRRL
jgi:glycosyltransferase involved in cell wall biosynthesis